MGLWTTLHAEQKAQINTSNHIITYVIYTDPNMYSPCMHVCTVIIAVATHNLMFSPSQSNTPTNRK